MRRREFLGVLGGATAAWPLWARAQQQSMPVIGYAAGLLKLSEAAFANVRRGLAQLGYVEGQNFRFDLRDANNQYERIPSLLRELADQKVALIIAFTTLQLAAAKGVTQSIPIVFHIGTDPVENGFVASLNKPGGNITGIYNLGLTMTGKRVEVLRELIPSLTKFAFLTDLGNKTLGELQAKQIQPAADSLGLNLLNVHAHTPDEFDAAFQTAVREGAGGVVVGADAMFGGAAAQLAAVAARYPLPVIYVESISVMAGGLISYGADLDDSQRLLGIYAGRILKGEKPADMPVQQATKTKMVINLKTAKTMGITVPLSLLGRADEVIE